MHPDDPFDQPGTVGELLSRWAARGFRLRWSLGPKAALCLVTVLGLIYSALSGNKQDPQSDHSTPIGIPEHVRYDKIEDWCSGKVVVYKRYHDGVADWTVDWESAPGVVKRLAGPQSSYPRVKKFDDGRLAVRLSRRRTPVPGGWETHVTAHVWKSIGDAPELVQSKISSAPIDHRKLSSNPSVASDLELDEAIVGVEGMVSAGTVGR